MAAPARTAGSFQIVRRAAQVARDWSLTARQHLARATGNTMGGLRNVGEALGYKNELTGDDYVIRYRRNEIAARIIELFAMSTWRAGAELIENDDPKVLTPFEETWYELDQRLKIWMRFLQADMMAGMGEYSVLFIGAPGEPGAKLERGTPEQLMYLRPYYQSDAKIIEWVDDPKDARYGQPQLYRLTLRTRTGKNVKNSLLTREVDVHWTRIVHFCDGGLESDFYSSPRLERVWNRLDDLEKVCGGGAEAFWLRANQGLWIDLDKDMELDDGEETALEDEVDEYENEQKRTIKTRGAKLKVLGSDVADFNSPVDALLTLIAGGTGIPKRILVGSERGELASTQDRSNFADRIHDRRMNIAGPLMVRQLVDRLIEYGYLPTPVEYEPRWPQAAILDDLEKSKLAETLAGLGPAIITEAEIRDSVLGLDPLEEPENSPNGPQNDPENDPAATLPDPNASPTGSPNDPETAAKTRQAATRQAKKSVKALVAARKMARKAGQQ